MRSVPSSAMTLELALGAPQVGGEPLGVGGVEVAEGLVEVDREAQVGAAGADLGGGERRRHEVRLEDLDAVEPGRRGGVELVLQRAGDADGGQRRAQPARLGRVLGGRRRAHGPGHGRPRFCSPPSLIRADAAARPFQPVESPHPRRLIRPASRATRSGAVVRSSRWPAPPICWTEPAAVAWVRGGTLVPGLVLRPRRPRARHGVLRAATAGHPHRRGRDRRGRRPVRRAVRRAGRSST